MVQEVDNWILIRTLFNKVNRLAEENLKKLEVTPSQFAILRLLACYKNMTMGEISKRVSCVNSNITSVIGRMIEKDLVKKEIDKQDRRIVKVKLTEKGYKLYQNIAPLHHDFIGEIYECLDENEFSNLTDLLAKLNKNLGSSEQECGT